LKACAAEKEEFFSVSVVDYIQRGGFSMPQPFHQFFVGQRAHNCTIQYSSETLQNFTNVEKHIA